MPETTPQAAQKSMADSILLLRDCTTSRYFCDGSWVEGPEQAQPFPNEEEAVRACAVHDLKEVDLVVRWPATGEELASRIRR